MVFSKDAGCIISRVNVNYIVIESDSKVLSGFQFRSHEIPGNNLESLSVIKACSVGSSAT
jgi:hypothetical protein